MLTFHTIVTKNNFDKNFQYFEDLCENYNRAKHKAFAIICKNNKNKNNNIINKNYILELTSKEKSQLAVDYNLTGRYVNSLNYELKGMISSYVELQKNHLEDIKHTFNSMMEEKEKLEKILQEYENNFSMVFTKYKTPKIKKLIKSYNIYCINNKLKFFTFKEYYKKSFTNKILTDNLIEYYKQKFNNKNLNLDNIVYLYAKNLKNLYFLKIKINNLHKNIVKTEKEIQNKKIRIYFNKNNLQNRYTSVYSMGCKNETGGNLNTTITYNKNSSLFDCRVRLLNDKNNNNTPKYFNIKNIDFGKKHNEILKRYIENQKQLKAPIHIRILKDKKNNKEIYRFYFSLDNETIKSIKNNDFNIFPKFKNILKNINNNLNNKLRNKFENLTYYDKFIIGVDINEKHISASIIDSSGKCLQSFDLYYYDFININQENISKQLIEKFNFATNNNKNLFNNIPNKVDVFNQYTNNTSSQIIRHKNKNYKFSSNQKQFVIGNIVKVLIELAKTHNASIAIEKLNFAQKKRMININNRIYKNKNKRIKQYNNMLNSFSYALFKNYLLTRAFEEDINVLHINPAYTSFIGLLTYTKPLGLSIHQAASLAIAKRAQLYLKNNVSTTLKSKQQPILENLNDFKINNVYQFKFLHQSKVHYLDYVVNNSLTKNTVDKLSKDNINNLYVWSEIYSLYKSYKENLYKNNNHKIL